MLIIFMYHIISWHSIEEEEGERQEHRGESYDLEDESSSSLRIVLHKTHAIRYRRAFNAPIVLLPVPAHTQEKEEEEERGTHTQ